MVLWFLKLEYTLVWSPEKKPPHLEEKESNFNPHKIRTFDFVLNTLLLLNLHLKKESLNVANPGLYAFKAHSAKFRLRR